MPVGTALAKPKFPTAYCPDAGTRLYSVSPATGASFPIHEEADCHRWFNSQTETYALKQVIDGCQTVLLLVNR